MVIGTRCESLSLRIGRFDVVALLELDLKHATQCELHAASI